MSSAKQKNVQILLLIHSRQFVIYNIFFRVCEITNLVGKLLLFLLFSFLLREENGNIGRRL